MWIFRITKGYGLKDPFGGCPVGVNIDRVKEAIRSNQKTRIVYDSHVEKPDFKAVWEEFWNESIDDPDKIIC